MALWRDGLHDQIVTRCETEAKLIVKLAEKVESTIDPLNLQPRQWYGPSAIASRCLAKWRARGQAKRLTESNTAHDLLRAIDCAYIGGRVEAVKLGTVKDVRLFDLNSAYAYAVTRLSQFYKPLRFTRNPVQHVRVPFSCWLVSYELPESATIGCMPQRAPGGQMSFRRRGKTWAWQPEVEYLAKHYPGCFQIHYGYVATAAKEGRKLWRSEREDKTGQPVTFGPKVSEMYDYRMALRAQGDAGEKIVKLALSNLYGKFAQNTGGAYYQCRAWAGWITSQVRRMLLDAITGIEDRVICFSQDAVHIEGADANVQIGDGLGEWKRSVYASGLYLAPGIYELTEQAADGRPQTAGKDKTATRGANLDLDFARMARELSGHQVTQLERAFVVGWALARQGAVRYESDYLQEISESLQLIPGRLRARNYAAQFDWLKENRSSEINQGCSGRESSRYLPQAGSGALRLRLKDRGWA